VSDLKVPDCSDSILQSTSQVLDAYFRETGGIDKWMSLQSIILTYESRAAEGMTHPNPAFTEYVYSLGYKICWKANDSTIYQRFVSSTVPDNDSTTTCYNGINYWRHLKGHPPDYFPDFARHYGRFVRMGEPMLVYTADSVELLLVTPLPTKEYNLECYKLKVYIDGAEYHYFISTKLNRLEGYSDSSGRTLTLFSDYRPTNGLLLPFKERTFKDGILVSEFDYYKIETDKAVPACVFEPPSDNNIVLCVQSFLN
jgi:hypothetical protein